MAKKYILVVDDQKTVTLALKYFLEARKYAVETALSGKEALAKFKEHVFDMVLLDIEMGEMKGTEVARIVKKDYPNTKIIIITNYKQDYKHELENIGVDAIFGKSIAFDSLAEEIERLLASSKNVKKEPKGVIPQARLFFIDRPTPVSLIKSYFQHKYGEFEIEVAVPEDIGLFSKLVMFKPDIIVYNASSFPDQSKVPDMLHLEKDITKAGFIPKDVIVYFDIDPTFSQPLGNDLLKSIEEAVDRAIFKLGLIKNN